ncbi:bola-like protein-domain-containing protein [Dipodascopsis uninucleata]
MNSIYRRSLLLSSARIRQQSFLQYRMSSSSASATSFVSKNEPDFNKSDTPYEDRIRWLITEHLKPTRLTIFNDSHKHAHHAPMRDSVSKETHFRLEIVSHAFEGKRLPMRHRQIYQLLSKELNAEGGVHALQLRTLTPKEEEDRAKKSD